MTKPLLSQLKGTSPLLTPLQQAPAWPKPSSSSLSIISAACLTCVLLRGDRPSEHCLFASRSRVVWNTHRSGSLLEVPRAGIQDGQPVRNSNDTHKTHTSVPGSGRRLWPCLSHFFLPGKDYLFPVHLNEVRGTKTATEPGGGGFRGRCSGGKSSKQEKANRSLEKGREGQREGRMARARSCQFSPCQSQPDLGQRGGASA